MMLLVMSYSTGAQNASYDLCLLLSFLCMYLVVTFYVNLMQIQQRFHFLLVV